MTTAMTIAPAELIQQVDRLHHEVLGYVKASLAKAREAGEALLKLKEVCKHGEFEKTVEMECQSLSVRTARTYMSIAGGWDLIMENLGPGQASQLTISDGMRLLCKHKRAKSAEIADFPLSEGGRAYEVLSTEGDFTPNPRPDAIKVAPDDRTKGDAPREVKSLFTRSENMYKVLEGLLAELQGLSPIPYGVISAIDGLSQSHLDFEAWRDAAGGWEDE